MNENLHRSTLVYELFQHNEDGTAYPSQIILHSQFFTTPCSVQCLRLPPGVSFPGLVLGRDYHLLPYAQAQSDQESFNFNLSETWDTVAEMGFFSRVRYTIVPWLDNERHSSCS